MIKETLSSGLFYKNPVFIAGLALCPSLAVTSSASDALALGIATFCALLLSNVFTSALRSYAPPPALFMLSVIFTAALAALADLIFRAYFFELSLSLGIFVPLIAVNCIILGRGFDYGAGHTVPRSALNSAALGLGYLLALLLISAAREFLGAGTFFGIDATLVPHIPFFLLPPGAFLAAALLSAVFKRLFKRKGAG